MAISGVKRAAMGWEAEQLPTGSSSSGFVSRHLFCLCVGVGIRWKWERPCLWTSCVILLLCAMSSWCVYKGLKVEWSKWRGGKPVDLFRVNDNAVLLLILCSSMGLTTLSLCCAVVGFLLPAG